MAPQVGSALSRRALSPFQTLAARVIYPFGSLDRFAARQVEVARRLLGGEARDSRPFSEQLEDSLDRTLRSRPAEQIADKAEAMATVLANPSLRLQYISALIVSGRRRTRDRARRGRLRALWGTTPIVNIIPCAAAERALGIEAETVVHTTYYVTHDFDLSFRAHAEAVAPRGERAVHAFLWLVFTWAVLRYDVFHYFYDRGILLPTGGYGSDFGINLVEMQILRRAEKRFFPMAYGADHRTRGRTLMLGKWNFCTECPEIGKFCVCNDEAGARMLAQISRYATAMVAAGTAAELIPGAIDLHYLVLDTSAVKPVVSAPPRGRSLRIAHAPNHPYFKGTRHLVAAVEQLRSEGTAIELKMLSGVPNHEVLELIRSADVVADQFIGGSYGYFAVEAMATGKPVLSFVRHPERVLAPDEFPIINTDPDGLVKTLRRLVRFPWVLAEAARGSARYVEAHLSVPALSGRLRKLYLLHGTFPWRMHRRLALGRGQAIVSFVLAKLVRAVRRVLPGWTAPTRLLELALERRRAIYRALRDSPVKALIYTMYATFRTLRHFPQVVGYWRALQATSADRRPESNEIVMIVISDARNDPRVEREARALAGAGFKVKVIWPDAATPRFADAPIDWGPNIAFRPAPAGAGMFVLGFPGLWGGPIHRMALEERPLAFHAHDLDTALIALSAARKAGALFVADFHEWYSENVRWSQWRRAWLPHPPLRRAFLRATERLVLRQADAVVTVCDGIARDLESSVYRREPPVQVVRNIPSFAARPTREYAPLKVELGVPDDYLLLLWQGGVGPTRFIEPVITALRSAPRVVFVVRGPGVERYGPAYRAQAKAEGTIDRLVLLPSVPSRDVVAAARGADVGIWTLPNLCKSFYYALPNKLFEYLAADLPVVAAAFPEARRIVEGHDVGLCFDPYSPESIALQLNRLADDRALLDRLRANIPAAMAGMRAEAEWQKLVDLYRELAASVGVQTTQPATAPVAG